MVFLTAASITLLLTFSLMIGLKGKTLKPSGSCSLSANFLFLLILGAADGSPNISEVEVLAGGLLRDEPLQGTINDGGYVFVAVCGGIGWAVELTGELLSESVKLSLYPGLFERRLLDERLPDCEVWDEELPESEVKGENPPSQRSASRLRPFTLLTLFRAVQITSDIAGLKRKGKIH